MAPGLSFTPDPSESHSPSSNPQLAAQCCRFRPQFLSLSFKTQWVLASHYLSGPISQYVPHDFPLLSNPPGPPLPLHLGSLLNLNASFHIHTLTKCEALVKDHLLCEGFHDSPDDQNESLLVLGSYFTSLCCKFLQLKNGNNDLYFVTSELLQGSNEMMHVLILISNILKS